MIYRVNGKRVSEEEFTKGSRGIDGMPGTMIRWPANRNRYISGAARFSNDPQAWCGSMEEAKEKIKRRGCEPVVT